LIAAGWKFGDFELDVSGFQLRDGPNRVRIERIPLELLILLAERHGQLVTRDEIAAHLWGKGFHIDTESSVNTAIRKVRAAINDSAEQPIFIETVSGKGYRFIGLIVPVEHPPVDTPPVAKEPAPATTANPVRAGLRWPLIGLALALVALVAVPLYFSGFARHIQPDAPTNIVVLPFQNLTGDPGQEYISDGLAEEAITAIGRLLPSQIGVIAWTSSMAYKGTGKTAREIGKELNASHLVEGAVRRDAQGMRVAARLIRVNDQVLVWSDTFHLDPAGLLEVQQQIGRAIAHHVGGRGSAPAVGTANRPVLDPDAHDLYLRSRYYSYQRTPDSMRKSIEYLEAALARDPSYAMAHAGLAEVNVVQTLISFANPAEQRKKAQAAIGKALSLDPQLAHGHAVAGVAGFFLEWDWKGAERSFQRAIELDPNSVTARQFYAHLLSNSSRHEEAIAEIQRAVQIDPLSPMMHSFNGAFLAMAGRYAESLPHLQRSLAIDPDFFPSHTVLGFVYQQTGKTDLALDEFRKAHRLSGGNVLQLAYQGYLLGRTGRLHEARQILNVLSQISQTRYVPPYSFALVYAGMSDFGAAFDWLNKAHEVRDVGLVSLPVDPRWDQARSDKRFPRLLDRCGFPAKL